MERTPVVGRRFRFSFGAGATYDLHFVDEHHLDVTVVEDATYPAGTVNHFEIAMVELRPNLYMVTWTEPATGNTVTHVEDYSSLTAYTNITDLASRQFWNLKGSIEALP